MGGGPAHPKVTELRRRNRRQAALRVVDTREGPIAGLGSGVGWALVFFATGEIGRSAAAEVWRATITSARDRRRQYPRGFLVGHRPYLVFGVGSSGRITIVRRGLLWVARGLWSGRCYDRPFGRVFVDLRDWRGVPDISQERIIATAGARPPMGAELRRFADLRGPAARRPRIAPCSRYAFFN